MSVITGRKLTKEEWFDYWEAVETPEWPMKKWDYTEWSDCLYAYEKYCENYEDNHPRKST